MIPFAYCFLQDITTFVVCLLLVLSFSSLSYSYGEINYKYLRRREEYCISSVLMFLQNNTTISANIFTRSRTAVRSVCVCVCVCEVSAVFVCICANCMCTCCTAFNYVLIWCEWQCSDTSHTRFRGTFIASGDFVWPGMSLSPSSSSPLQDSGITLGCSLGFP